MTMPLSPGVFSPVVARCVMGSWAAAMMCGSERYAAWSGS